jgi:hypothetical protein
MGEFGDDYMYTDNCFRTRPKFYMGLYLRLEELGSNRYSSKHRMGQMLKFNFAWSRPVQANQNSTKCVKVAMY